MGSWLPMTLNPVLHFLRDNAKSENYKLLNVTRGNMSLVRKKKNYPWIKSVFPILLSRRQWALRFIVEFNFSWTILTSTVQFVSINLISIQILKKRVKKWFVYWVIHLQNLVLYFWEILTSSSYLWFGVEIENCLYDLLLYVRFLH